MSESDPRILAINVGNSRTAYGLFLGGEAESSGAIRNAEYDALIKRLGEIAGALDDDGVNAIVVASVNDTVAHRIIADLQKSTGRDVHRVGPDVPISMPHALAENHTTGNDRLLVALAAFKEAGQACVVIDAGTAITVDFIDGEGTYQGGAILPGVRLSLDALHESTAQLPAVQLRAPDASAHFPKTTEEAMIQGVVLGARGAVRQLVEGYAEAYGGYPRIFATGGDAELLFADDEFVERIIPDLALRGVALTTLAALQGVASEADSAGSAE